MSDVMDFYNGKKSIKGTIVVTEDGIDVVDAEFVDIEGADTNETN